MYFPNSNVNFGILSSWLSDYSGWSHAISFKVYMHSLDINSENIKKREKLFASSLLCPLEPRHILLGAHHGFA